MSAAATPLCGMALRVFSIFTASTGFFSPDLPPVKGWVEGGGLALDGAAPGVPGGAAFAGLSEPEQPASEPPSAITPNMAAVLPRTIPFHAFRTIHPFSGDPPEVSELS